MLKKITFFQLWIPCYSFLIIKRKFITVFLSSVQDTQGYVNINHQQKEGSILLYSTVFLWIIYYWDICSVYIIMFYISCTPEYWKVPGTYWVIKHSFFLNGTVISFIINYSNFKKNHQQYNFEMIIGFKIFSTSRFKDKTVFLTSRMYAEVNIFLFSHNKVNLKQVFFICMKIYYLINLLGQMNIRKLFTTGKADLPTHDLLTCDFFWLS